MVVVQFEGQSVFSSISRPTPLAKMTMGMMNMRTAATKTTPSAVHAWAHENVQTTVMIIPAAMKTILMATGAVFGSPLFPLGSLSPCGARALFMNHLPFRLRELCPYCADTFPIFQYCDHIRHFPKLVRDTYRHRGGDFQRLMNADEIVVHEIDRHHVSMVRGLL